MTSLRAIFWKGLATLLPLTVTVYALYWVVVSTERLLRQLVPVELYFPGSGLLLAVVLIGVFGALMHFFLFEWLINLGSSLLNRIPVVKSVYSALQDFFSYLGHRSTDDLSRVVLVTLTDSCQLIGFVTNPRFQLPSAAAYESAAPESAAPAGAVDERLAVYLPMSYQIGGFMVLLPAAQVRPLDISVEDAMRLVLTAGVREPERQSQPKS
ncbi:MAG: DUF502 domain-containing protein [Pseudomonadales bacterium]